MYVPVIAASLIAGATILAFAVLFLKLVSPRRCQIVSPEWLSRFSVAKYRPMERLFSEDDYRYLAAQRGYRPEIGRQLRRERIRVFRGYLKCLRADFTRLEAAVNLWMANSPTDRPDLAKTLLKQRLLFTYAMLGAEVRLVLHSAGMGTVDVHGLVGSLDGMRVELRRLALVRQGSLA